MFHLTRQSSIVKDCTGDQLRLSTSSSPAWRPSLQPALRPAFLILVTPSHSFSSTPASTSAGPSSSPTAAASLPTPSSVAASQATNPATAKRAPDFPPQYAHFFREQPYLAGKNVSYESATFERMGDLVQIVWQLSFVSGPHMFPVFFAVATSTSRRCIFVDREPRHGLSCAWGEPCCQ